MSLLNGKVHSVVMDGDNREVRVSTYHLAVLERHYGSIDGINDAMQKRSSETALVVVLLSLGHVTPADLRGDQSILFAKLDEFGPRLSGKALAVAEAAFGALADAMADEDQQAEIQKANGRPTTGAAAPTPSLT